MKAVKIDLFKVNLTKPLPIFNYDYMLIRRASTEIAKILVVWLISLLNILIRIEMTSPECLFERQVQYHLVEIRFLIQSKMVFTLYFSTFSLSVDVDGCLSLEP